MTSGYDRIGSLRVPLSVQMIIGWRFGGGGRKNGTRIHDLNKITYLCYLIMFILFSKRH